MNISKDLNSDPLWYKDAVIYELHIKAFKDSNGDGIGDFRGLIEKLDYLQDLGVTAIWLLPFYPSPQRDDGYDIADYLSINPSYGVVRDFKVLMREAHKRGLRVITELVINHTSDRHPWFQRAREAKKGSPYRDYYVWSDDPDKYKDTRIIFQDFEQSNWTWDAVAGQYYWHRFYHHQPDLNFENPRVRQEVIKALDFWANLGVDGFRLDAIPYLFEREGTNCENLPETHVYLKELRKHMDEHHPGKMFLAEANMWPEQAAAYFGDGDECHMNFHFPIMPRLFMAVKMEERHPIVDILEQTPDIPANCQWAMFLRNHDELTLEMVTDEERDYMYKVYAKDPMARINLGIRHRLAPLMDGDRRKIELMNVLLFSMPGTPVLYYGDEIGMGDNFYLGDRNGVRTPMQWNADRNAGFSDANPQKLYLPAIIDPEYNYETVNVETQLRNQNSLLWWTKHTIEMRQRYRAFGRGSITFIASSNPKILAFMRCHEEENVLVVVNLSRFAEPVELEMGAFHGFTPQEMFSQNKFPRVGRQPYLLTLSPYGYYWFVMRPELASLKAAELSDEPALTLKKWEELAGAVMAESFAERVLAPYLLRVRWFGGKARVIQSVRVTDTVPLGTKDDRALLLLLEVSYNEGFAERYQLPVTVSTHGGEVERLRDQSPQGLMAAVTLAGQPGVLYDAVYSEPFQQLLFNALARRQKFRSATGELAFNADRVVDKARKELEEVRSRVLSAEQSNTSMIFADRFFLKLYRKLDDTLNPDVEITRFLTEQAQFAHTPRYLGNVAWQRGKSVFVMGMLQELVANQGDAWAYFKGPLGRYFERVEAMTADERATPPARVGTLTQPASFDQTPDVLKEIIGGAYVERLELLGRRTAEMHLALAGHGKVAGFETEDFSLHYQRSLYSSLQSMVKNNFSTLKGQLSTLSEATQPEARQVLTLRDEVMATMKQIYDHKIETVKIRNHGDYHLGQVLFTGKDFVIIDFEGEPARSFSERRLRRSALRDVAGMLRSFHYAAYSALFSKDGGGDERAAWAEEWYHYAGGFFLRSYLETLGANSPLIPSNPDDFDLLLRIFLLEKAVYELGYELNNRPTWVGIPLRGIRNLMEQEGVVR